MQAGLAGTQSRVLRGSTLQRQQEPAGTTGALASP